MTIPRGRAWRLALLAPEQNVLAELPDDVGGPGWFVGDILVFWRAGQLSAGRFDLDKLAIIGEPVGVSDVPNYSSYGLRPSQATEACGTAFARVDPVARRAPRPTHAIKELGV